MRLSCVCMYRKCFFQIRHIKKPVMFLKMIVKKWPLFKLLHNPFESEVPGYNGCHSYFCLKLLKLKLFVHRSLCFQESSVICKHENSRQMENGRTDIDNYVIQNPNSFTAAFLKTWLTGKKLSPTGTKSELIER